MDTSPPASPPPQPSIPPSTGEKEDGCLPYVVLVEHRARFFLPGQTCVETDAYLAIEEWHTPGDAETHTGRERERERNGSLFQMGLVFDGRIKEKRISYYNI